MERKASAPLRRALVLCHVLCVATLYGGLDDSAHHKSLYTSSASHAQTSGAVRLIAPTV